MIVSDVLKYADFDNAVYMRDMYDRFTREYESISVLFFRAAGDSFDVHAGEHHSAKQDRIIYTGHDDGYAAHIICECSKRYIREIG